MRDQLSASTVPFLRFYFSRRTLLRRALVYYAILLIDSAKVTWRSYDSGSQSRPRIWGKPYGTTCHRLWSPRGRAARLVSSYLGARTCLWAPALISWSCWPRSWKPRTTRSLKVHWIRHVSCKSCERVSIGEHSFALREITFYSFRLLNLKPSMKGDIEIARCTGFSRSFSRIDPRGNKSWSLSVSSVVKNFVQISAD